MIYQRKLNKKTDYRKRLQYLISRKPRLVIRKSNKQLKSQIIEYTPSGDKTIVSAASRDLVRFGYKGSIKNTPSAYLTGILMAKKAKEKSIKTAVPDIGFHSITKGSIILAFIKGVQDGGLDVKIKDSILPDKKRIQGEHIAAYTKDQTIPKQFENIKEKLLKK